MKIIKAGYQILGMDLNDPKTVQSIYRHIEIAGRTCYKSEDKISDNSAEKFVRAMVKSGHEAMLEHAGMTVRFIVDRGVSHELVRHRVASFAQESSRYSNYSKDKFGKEITVIEPVFFKDIPKGKKGAIMDFVDGVIKYDDFPGITASDERIFWEWYTACAVAERSYFEMLEFGAKPEEARSVLPTSLKTEVVMTANMREWRHFLNLRAAGTTGKPHPQMLEVAVPLLNELREKLPALFEDILPMEMEE